jgi:hypothetical protein
LCATAEKAQTNREGRNRCRHFVQLYGTEFGSLACSAARFFADGLESGDGLLLIATSGNVTLFERELAALSVNPRELSDSGTLTVLDAGDALRLFMRNDRPDPDLFRDSIGGQVQRLRSVSRSGEITAYGEMVGVLWTDGRFTAAMELEVLWNDLLGSTGSKLLCGYPIDVFAAGFHYCDIDGLLANHSHVVPAEGNPHIEEAVNRAMEEVLGPAADELRIRMRNERQPAWAATLPAEALILWLRANVSACADRILSRARQHYLSRDFRPARSSQTGIAG